MDKERLTGISLVILATIFMGTSGIFINWVVLGSSLTPLGLAFWRDLTTFLVLLVGMGILKPKLLKVKRSDIPWLAVMGAVSIGVFHVLWNTSVLKNGASIATVIQSNAPIFVSILAWLIWRESLSWQKFTAILVSIIGTVLIANPDNLSGAQITTDGLLIGLASAITYGAYSLFGKKLRGSYNSWTILLYIFGFGALTLAPFQIGSNLPWPVDTSTWVNFAGLIAFPTIGGFAFYTLGLGRLQASVASITATAEILFASIFAFILLGERLDGWQVLGTVCIVLGVILVSLPAGKKESAEIIPEGPKYSL
jgi:drug/metabolite transporter (DMT)-like permease